jgi:serine/threonine protein kinase
MQQSRVRRGSVHAGFRIEKVVGEGAMGIVYLAEDTRRGGTVGLKVLAPELARDDRFRQRFLRESQLAETLHLPHAVPVVASGEEDGLLYLAMRLPIWVESQRGLCFSRQASSCAVAPARLSQTANSKKHAGRC